VAVATRRRQRHPAWVGSAASAGRGEVSSDERGLQVRAAACRYLDHGSGQPLSASPTY